MAPSVKNKIHHETGQGHDAKGIVSCTSISIHKIVSSSIRGVRSTGCKDVSQNISHMDRIAVALKITFELTNNRLAATPVVREVIHNSSLRRLSK